LGAGEIQTTDLFGAQKAKKQGKANGELSSSQLPTKILSKFWFFFGSL